MASTMVSWTRRNRLIICSTLFHLVRQSNSNKSSFPCFDLICFCRTEFFTGERLKSFTICLTIFRISSISGRISESHVSSSAPPSSMYSLSVSLPSALSISLKLLKIEFKLEAAITFF